MKIAAFTIGMSLMLGSAPLLAQAASAGAQPGNASTSTDAQLARRLAAEKRARDSGNPARIAQSRSEAREAYRNDYLADHNLANKGKRNRKSKLDDDDKRPVTPVAAH